MQSHSSAKVVLHACKTCGNLFRPRQQLTPNRLNGHPALYCSRSCFYASYGTPEQRFWAKVDRSNPNGCWPWLGSKRKRGKGHGYFMVDGKSISAHRYALILATGGDRPGMEACHTCDNPPCCRDDHLFWGTNADNMADMVKKGRWANGTHHGPANPRHLRAS